MVPQDGYHNALDALDQPKQFEFLAGQEWFQKIEEQVRKETNCFAWELAFPEVFFAGTERHARPGFDAIIGNPPYEVLSEKESGMDLKALRAFIKAEPTYEPAQIGKQNLYKLFICRCLSLLADDARFGFIVPMSLLGDEITSGIRKAMAAQGAFVAIEAFPQKDKPDDRVFLEAKLSTCIFVFEKTSTAAGQRFRARTHPGKIVNDGSPSLSLSTADIPKYDPENFTIVSCSQSDWDMAVKIMASGRMGRLGEHAEFFQGEVNETNERAKGTLASTPSEGHLVTRGASVCLYVIRPASQGEDLYLNVSAFLHGKAPATKAHHHKQRRVGWQESSPQNNFRRIIAALISSGEFCNHTINYCPVQLCKFELELLTAILDCRLSDWYFRLGSTNAHVSQYQVANLPCPEFSRSRTSTDDRTRDEAIAHLRAGRTTNALKVLRQLLDTPPFSTAVRDAIIEAANRIIAIEKERGEISRSARSALDPAAQPYQDFIDQLMYGMAGLNAEDVQVLEANYAKML
jgi:Eco57I restriction-modification methylase